MKKLAEMHKEVNDICNRYQSSPIDSDLLRSLKLHISTYFDSNFSSLWRQGIQFDIVFDAINISVRFVPLNLYTFVFMANREEYMPPNVAFNQDEQINWNSSNYMYFIMDNEYKVISRDSFDLRSFTA